MTTILNVLVALLLPKKVLDLLNFAKTVLKSMTGNAFFPTPTPTLAQLSAAITALDAAQVLAASRAKGAVQARNGVRKNLIVLLKQMRDYVQSIVETQIADALAIATSAGMTLAKRTLRTKPELAVKQGELAGTVLLVAKAVAGATTYYWSFSLDQKSWSSAPETTKAKTTISGLTVGQTYYFRFCTLARKVEAKSDPSQAISFLVK
jgi:hypothetical protein